MTKRQVFYSFHYKPDCWRASMIRSIGAIEGNDWETIASSGDEAIKRWISEQMKNRSCTIVLVGNKTAKRKWINHEIIKSWNNNMGVVGIYIHGIKNSQGLITKKGLNPFDYIPYGDDGEKLSSIVRCYNPGGSNSKENYDWIKRNIRNAAEEAVKIRQKN